MKILNFGSLNIDRVYSVDRFAVSGETIFAKDFEINCGGKGLNQSIALARAGAKVYHAGAVGTDGGILLDLLKAEGVDTQFVRVVNEATGHAIIQVDKMGENRITVCEGANQDISRCYINEVLENFAPGDLLLIQNEISNADYTIEASKRKGMYVVFNASPVQETIFDYPLQQVDLFIINEVEARQLLHADINASYEELLDMWCQNFSAALAMTVGSEGAYYQANGIRIYCPGCDVYAVDTTAAGDTFCGYFLAGITSGMQFSAALSYANKFAGIAVSRKGAAKSIPYCDEILI